MSRGKNKQGNSAFKKERQSQGVLPNLPTPAVDLREGYPKNKSFVLDISEVYTSADGERMISGEVMKGHVSNDQEVFWFDKEGSFQSGMISKIVGSLQLGNLPVAATYVAIGISHSTTDEWPASGYLWTP